MKQYTLSLVVLMLSAGHNSHQHTHAHTLTQDQIYAHSYTPVQMHRKQYFYLAGCVSVFPTLHLGQRRYTDV